MCSSDVHSLLQISLWRIVGSFDVFSGEVVNLPVILKSRLLDIMSKRGLITDINIDLLLSDNVKTLDMSHSDVTDLALYKIAKFCPYLIKIDLNSHKHPRLGVTSAGIVQLATNCKYMQSVYLRHCSEITDSGVVSLVESCKSLRELNLGKCPLISDTSLIAIGENCTKLISLNLSKTIITDDGIFKMVMGPCSKTLKEVHIDNCIFVTDDSVSDLINFCPNLSVFVFHNCPNITEQSRVELENIQSVKKMHFTFTVY